MKKKILIIALITMFALCCFSACKKIERGSCEKCITDIFTVSKITQDGCGHLLHRGLNPNLYHSNFVWAKNLPQKYIKDNLHVSVTYYIMDGGNHSTEEGYIETDCGYPIIYITKIEKL